MKLCVLLAINFFQAFAYDYYIVDPHAPSRRSPQYGNNGPYIQSIRQKQVSPDITVVDVVVNEPVNNRNQQNYYQKQYQNPYPNNPFFNRNNPETIKIIEVIEPVKPNDCYPGSGCRYKPNQRPQYPNYPNRDNFYPDVKPIPDEPKRVVTTVKPPYNGCYPGSDCRYKPDPKEDNFHPDRKPDEPKAVTTENIILTTRKPTNKPTKKGGNIFHFNQDILKGDDDDDKPRPFDRKPPTLRARKGVKDSSEKSEEYIFDAAESRNYPVVKIKKNEIRR